MRIALLGTRGIPANYGGFETFAEEISARLAERGHEVTVYCRAHYATVPGKTWRGVRLVVLPTIRAKHLDTPVHTVLSCLHLLWAGADVAIICNGANAVFSYWPRLRRIRTVLNVDGLERKRKKWKRVARAWFGFAERLATLCPDVVVTDARVIQRYYRERYRLETACIAYGAPSRPVETTGSLDHLGLEARDYFLYVSRFEPENNALLVVKEFERSGTKRKLVMVGDAPYAASYIKLVRATRDPRITFAGAVYGRRYEELQSHCFAYVHASEVGGTHPALVEAMGRRCAILYLDTPENREVAGRAGLAYGSEDGSLRGRIEEVDSASSLRLGALRAASAEEARQHYDWKDVTERYESLLEDLAGTL